jgi:hypothetical protein
MMDFGNEVPAHVLRFLQESIDTVPQLETLLMMNEAPDQTWLITDVASRNYISEQRATDILSALQRRNLVSTEGSPPRFRFNPASEDIRLAIADLARCYRRHLSRITAFIHEKPSASVKEFARAFDLKKDR